MEYSNIYESRNSQREGDFAYAKRARALAIKSETIGLTLHEEMELCGYMQSVTPTEAQAVEETKEAFMSTATEKQFKGLLSFVKQSNVQ